jgi:hypothetical protein
MAERGAEVRGAKTKLFGVVLLIVGALDFMLSWRGGFMPSGFFVLLFGAGLLLYVIGSVRAGGGKTDP